MEVEERGVDVMLEVEDAARLRAIAATAGLFEKIAVWICGG